MFRPSDINPNLGALSGSVFASSTARDPDEDFVVMDRTDLYPRMHSASSSGDKCKTTVIVVLISAFLFIAIVSCFEVVRNCLYTYYPLPKNHEPKTISKRLLDISVIFAVFGVVVAVVVTFYLLRSCK
jgi:hypothetical protein